MTSQSTREALQHCVWWKPTLTEYAILPCVCSLHGEFPVTFPGAIYYELHILQAMAWESTHRMVLSFFQLVTSGFFQVPRTNCCGSGNTWPLFQSSSSIKTLMRAAIPGWKHTGSFCQCSAGTQDESTSTWLCSDLYRMPLCHWFMAHKYFHS